MKGLFITGTGTGVGKTRATGLLLAALRQRGLDAVAIKPIQTGANVGEIAPDVAEHMRLADWHPAYPARYAPIVLRDPVSPHLAAEREGRTLEIAEIVEATRAAAEGHAFALVEGAGGILVPINRRETMRDFAVALGLPVLVVAQAGLGTINHTLLTLAALRAAGLEPHGVLLNETEPTDTGLAADNARCIEEMGETRVFGVISHGTETPSASIETLIDALR